MNSRTLGASNALNASNAVEHGYSISNMRVSGIQNIWIQRVWYRNEGVLSSYSNAIINRSTEIVLAAGSYLCRHDSALYIASLAVSSIAEKEANVDPGNIIANFSREPSHPRSAIILLKHDGRTPVRYCFVSGTNEMKLFSYLDPVDHPNEPQSGKRIVIIALPGRMKIAILLSYWAST